MKIFGRKSHASGEIFIFMHENIISMYGKSHIFMHEIFMPQIFHASNFSHQGNAGPVGAVSTDSPPPGIKNLTMNKLESCH